MTLDLSKIVLKLDNLADDARERHADGAMLQFSHAYEAIDSLDLARRIRTAKTSWLLAIADGRFQEVVPAPQPPEDYTVVASDGSFIVPDRHSPARFFVINIGKVILRYGKRPHAEIAAEPSMYFREEELFVPDNLRRIPVSGAVLGYKRAAEELESVAAIALEQPAPAIALQDGTLIQWGLESQLESVKTWVLKQYLDALEALQERGIPVASYISFPASSDVVNSVRVSVCDYPDHGRAVNCDHCRARIAREQHVPACEFIPDVTDRSLFELVAKLQPGERSQIFASRSKILQDYPHDQQILFFYLHSGTEVGRVEIPRWVAADEQQLDLVHSAIFEQCTLGRGYPSALQEAHEIAAIRPDERQAVEALVEEALVRHGLKFRRSGKADSKRGRFV